MTGTITQATGSGASSFTRPGDVFTFAVTSDGLLADLDSSFSRGYFPISGESLSLTSGSLSASTTMAFWEVVPTGSALLAAATPFTSVDGYNVSSLYVSFTGGSFIGDQQPLDILALNQWAGKQLNFSIGGNSLQYIGSISSVDMQHMAAVPEPSTWVMLTIGAAAILFRKRFAEWRRKRRERARVKTFNRRWIWWEPARPSRR